MTRFLLASVAATALLTSLAAHAHAETQQAKIGGTVESAAETPDDTKLQAKIKEIEAKYEPQIQALKAEGEEATKNLPGPEANVTGVNVKMKRVDVYVKIPESNGIHQQTWFVRIPEFRMVPHRIVMHVPEPCMQYRPFPWGGGMHVPGICMREKEWRYVSPEVVMREQKWIVGVPEFSMSEKHYSFDVPDTVESSKKKVDAAKAKTEEVDHRAQQLMGAMNAEINAAIREYLGATRHGIAAQFEPQIKMLQAVLAAAPSEAKGELTLKLAELEKARDEALKVIDEQLAKVS